jgi:hypothetical protein
MQCLAHAPGRWGAGRRLRYDRTSLWSHERVGLVPIRCQATIPMPKPRSRQKPAKPDPLKEWAMILFESLGFGMLAILIALSVVLLAVGLYVQVIWPLTDWDLVNVSLEPYQSLVSTVLLSIFAFGSGLGFWFVSGAAWKR